MPSHSTKWRKYEHEDKRQRRCKNAQLAFIEMKTRVFESLKKKKVMGGINGQLDTAEENIRKLVVTAIGIILNEAEREREREN